MKEKENMQQEITKENVIQNPSRRKMVKTIIIGAGTIAAYHTLPTKWSTPIIDQICLPAHAATSGEGEGFLGPCTFVELSTTQADYRILVEGYISPPRAGITIRIDAWGYVASGAMVGGGNATTVTDANGKYSFLAFPSPGTYWKVEFVISSQAFAGDVKCSYMVRVKAITGHPVPDPPPQVFRN